MGRGFGRRAPPGRGNPARNQLRRAARERGLVWDEDSGTAFYPQRAVAPPQQRVDRDVVVLHPVEAAARLDRMRSASIASDTPLDVRGSVPSAARAAVSDAPASGPNWQVKLEASRAKTAGGTVRTIEDEARYRGVTVEEVVRQDALRTSARAVKRARRSAASGAKRSSKRVRRAAPAAAAAPAARGAAAVDLDVDESEDDWATRGNSGEDDLRGQPGGVSMEAAAPPVQRAPLPAAHTSSAPPHSSSLCALSSSRGAAVERVRRRERKVVTDPACDEMMEELEGERGDGDWGCSAEGRGSGGGEDLGARGSGGYSGGRARGPTRGGYDEGRRGGRRNDDRRGGDTDCRGGYDANRRSYDDRRRGYADGRAPRGSYRRFDSSERYRGPTSSERTGRSRASPSRWEPPPAGSERVKRERDATSADRVKREGDAGAGALVGVDAAPRRSPARLGRESVVASHGEQRALVGSPRIIRVLSPGECVNARYERALARGEVAYIG